MDSIYEEFERLVKEKGKRIKKFLPGIENGSMWQIENLFVVIDESALLNENKIVAIVDIADENFFYVIYISPLALENGAKEFFGIIDNRMSSNEKLTQIFEKIKTGGQLNSGFFYFKPIKFVLNDYLTSLNFSEKLTNFSKLIISKSSFLSKPFMGSFLFGLNFSKNRDSPR